jgi:hypothetical protein
MATGSLEERVEQLEKKLAGVEERIAHQSSIAGSKRGWRWFVGIDSNNPHFEEAVRQGQEWRNSDPETESR